MCKLLATLITSLALLIGVAYVVNRACADTCRCWRYDANNLCAVRDCEREGEVWVKTISNTLPRRCVDTNDPNANCSEKMVQGVCASGYFYRDSNCVVEGPLWYTVYTGPWAEKESTPCPTAK